MKDFSLKVWAKNVGAHCTWQNMDNTPGFKSGQFDYGAVSLTEGHMC